uniref:Uncharacterized protein n=1 Tax=Rhizophora mucronata TaxID=61149 RepID=A0A2P2N0Q4_RHIMU
MNHFPEMKFILVLGEMCLIIST